MSVRFSPAIFLFVATTAACLSSAHSETIGSAPSSSTGLTADNYLPDSVVLARVDDRIIRVGDFREGYFSSLAEYRPSPDAAGQREFLDNMVNKEVLALAALSINRPLDFEDRSVLRQVTDRAIANRLYERRVYEPSTPTEQEIQEVYPQFATEILARHVLVESHALAEQIRRDLLAGRLTWKEAIDRYSIGRTKHHGGELGWLVRTAVRGDMALKVFGLRPGGVSEVAQTPDGYHVVQCLDRRDSRLLPLSTVRRMIVEDLRMQKAIPYLKAYYDDLRSIQGVWYDTTAIRDAMEKFREFQLAPEREGFVVDISGGIPEFAPQELERVLARSGERELTLDGFIRAYRAIPVVTRRKIVGMQPILETIDGIILEPEMVELGRRTGIDQDPRTRMVVERKLEEIHVEHLYEDSVLSHVRVTPEERRAYFEKYRHRFVSIPSVRYVRLARRGEASIDSLEKALLDGADAVAIAKADSLRGWLYSQVAEAQSGHLGRFQTLLLEEMKPAEIRKMGPDPNDMFVLFKLLSRAESSPLSFEQVETIVDESIRNEKAELLLAALLERLKPRYRIVSYPERLAQVRMLDPVLDQP